MSTSYFGFIALTGGGTGALDKLDGAILLDEDYANGVVGIYNYVYQLVAASGATPDGENIIIPLTNPGTKRWILRNKSASVNTGDAASLPIGGGTLTGDLNVGTTSVGHNVALKATEGSEMCPALEAVNWTCTNGWSAGSGSLVRASNPSTGTATPSGTFTVIAGRTYKVTMTISAVVGVVTYHIGGSLGRQLTATTFTDYVNAITTDKIIFTGITGTTCTITSLSIKELSATTGDLRVYGRTITGSGIWSDNDSKAIDILPQGDIGVRGIRYNLTPNDQEFAEGKTYWDSIWKTLNVQTTTDITLPVGQTEILRVYNNTGSVLNKGKAVYPNGIHSDGSSSTVTIALARANLDTTSDVLGVTTQDIPIASYGFITVRGNINNIDTTVITASAGDILYLSADTAGELVNTVPVAPNLEIRVGRLIIDDATTGRINVRISQAYRLNDLVDVAVLTPSVGQLLKFDGVSWIAADTSTVAGAGTVNYFLTDQDVAIEGMTRAAACVVTWTAHGLATGDYVQMAGITQAGWTALNWTLAAPVFHKITYIGDNTFSIAVNTSGYADDYNAAVDPGTISSGKLQSTPNTAIATQTDSAQSTGSVEALIDTYSTSILNRTTIDSGLWEFHTWCYASSATDVNTIVIRVYKRNTAGTETQLFTVETADLGISSTESIIASPQPAYTILATDHLVVKYYAKSNRGAGNYRTLYMTHNGSTVYSYFRTPITILHDELAGLNAGPYSHLSAIEKASAIRDATAVQDGKMTAAYASKLDGIALGATANTKASVAEVLVGTDDTKFVTPLGLASGNGATLPPTPYKGQLFLHTPTGRNILLQYNGTNWIPIYAYGATTVYVSTTGTDDQAHGTATGTSAFLTLDYARTQIPTSCSGNVTINMGAGTFSENVVFRGIYPAGGNYTLTINGTQTVLTTGTMDSGVIGAGSSPISGTLVIGQSYFINLFKAGDDFTNVGASSNATGVSFFATGTTPTIWANGSALICVGQGNITKAGAFAAVVTTTVNATSNSGQKVLGVAATTGFAVGDVVLLNSGGVRQELITVASIQAGVSLTAVSNLQYTHTSVQADIVDQCQYSGKQITVGTDIRVIDYHTADTVYIAGYFGSAPSGTYTINEYSTVLGVSVSTATITATTVMPIYLRMLKLVGNVTGSIFCTLFAYNCETTATGTWASPCPGYVSVNQCHFVNAGIQFAGGSGVVTNCLFKNVAASAYAVTSFRMAYMQLRNGTVISGYSYGVMASDYGLVHCNATYTLFRGCTVGMDVRTGGYVSGLIQQYTNCGTNCITIQTITGYQQYADTPDIVSAAGAISIVTPITHIVTNGAATSLTLGNGVEGQQKIIVLKTLTSAGHSDVITPAGGGAGFTTITMAALGATVTLLYTNSKWTVIGAINVATA